MPIILPWGSYATRPALDALHEDVQRYAHQLETSNAERHCQMV
jgi:hypothetical protein